MTKGILCTVDFSESSMDALRWSVSVAKLLNLPLTVLYTYRLANSNGEAMQLRKKTEEDARQKFIKVEKEILACCGVEYEFKVEVGFVSNRVKHYAKNNDVSFVVMGNKINAANKETFDELAETIPVPLVIVP